MATKFVREKNLVERLVQCLGLTVDGYEDPNASDRETGADVVILTSGARIGVQVTILDTGPYPGKPSLRRRKRRKGLILTAASMAIGASPTP
jgi:hypothetical protein